MKLLYKTDKIIALICFVIEIYFYNTQQNWIGEKIAYWCRNHSLKFQPKVGGPYEKFVFGKCQQEGGLDPWWTVSDPLPKCVEEKGISFSRNNLRLLKVYPTILVT